MYLNNLFSYCPANCASFVYSSSYVPLVASKVYNRFIIFLASFYVRIIRLLSRFIILSTNVLIYKEITIINICTRRELHPYTVIAANNIFIRNDSTDFSCIRICNLVAWYHFGKFGFHLV